MKQTIISILIISIISIACTFNKTPEFIKITDINILEPEFDLIFAHSFK